MHQYQRKTSILIKTFFPGEGPTKVSQYSILEYNDNLLLFQTTPGLDNYQLYIQDMRIVEL